MPCTFSVCAVLTLLYEWSANPMDKGRFGGIRIPKPRNRLTQHLVWVIMSAISACMPKFKTIAPLGVPAYGWNITRVVFIFFSFFLWPQSLLASRDKTAQPIFMQFGMMSFPAYCIRRGMKMQKVTILPYFHPSNTSKRSVNRRFRAKHAKYSNFCIIKTAAAFFKQILHSDKDQVLFVVWTKMCPTNPRWRAATMLKKW